MLFVGFQVYAAFVVAACVLLIYYYVPRMGKTNILIYIAICSLVGSISVIGCKVPQYRCSMRWMR